MNQVSRTYLDQAAQAQGFTNRTASPAVPNAMTAGAGAGEQLQPALRSQQVLQAENNKEILQIPQGLVGEMGAQRSVEAGINQEDYRANVAMQLNGYIAANADMLNIPRGGALSNIDGEFLEMIATQMT